MRDDIEGIRKYRVRLYHLSSFSTCVSLEDGAISKILIRNLLTAPFVLRTCANAKTGCLAGPAVCRFSGGTGSCARCETNNCNI